MNLRNSIFLIFLIIVIAFESKGQDYIMIKGTVYNLRGETLPGANAVNISKNYGTFTDYSGDFTLILAKNDTLKVSMVGFKPFLYKIPEKLKGLNYSMKITLMADTLILQETEIRPYPATYAEFRQEFVTMKTPEEKIINDMNLPTEPFRKRYESPEGGLLLPGPFSLLYDNFSKEAKQKKKMAEINRKNNLRDKFIELVTRETLLIEYNCRTEDEIDELLEFCGINLSDIEIHKPYYIVSKLNKCADSWKKNNPSSEGQP